uniref:Uncharacterized protein n=1 Tax=Oryza punctata TaxID=4537 RepID=A0A0E0M0N1_ORYPU
MRGSTRTQAGSLRCLRTVVGPPEVVIGSWLSASTYAPVSLSAPCLHGHGPWTSVRQHLVLFCSSLLS